METPNTSFTPSKSQEREGGGVQHWYNFPNGHVASVVREPRSYGWADGLWELAVLDAHNHLVFDTTVTEGTNGVLGNRTDAAVDTALAKLRDYDAGKAKTPAAPTPNNGDTK